MKTCHASPLRLVGPKNDMLEKIKKCSNRNEYILTPDRIWVRNFCKPATPYIGMNNLIKKEEYKILIENEIENKKKKYGPIPTEKKREKVIIISDGYDFSTKHKILSNVSQDISVIAVNKALALWELVGNNCEENKKKAIAYYVINNPYKEAELFLPKKKSYYPKCLTSCRTFPGFLKLYNGPIYSYTPVPEIGYGGIFSGGLMIDDYRNPICAAINFSKILGAKKVMLMCCDNSFKDNRPGSQLLENGLFCYPQQIFSSNTIDACCYWMVKNEIMMGDFSSGKKMKNAQYISNEMEMLEFFKD